jgi:hypothetical protein
MLPASDSGKPSPEATVPRDGYAPCCRNEDGELEELAWNPDDRVRAALRAVDA